MRRHNGEQLDFHWQGGRRQVRVRLVRFVCARCAISSAAAHVMSTQLVNDVHIIYPNFRAQNVRKHFSETSWNHRLGASTCRKHDSCELHRRTLEALKSLSMEFGLLGSSGDGIEAVTELP